MTVSTAPNPPVINAIIDINNSTVRVTWTRPTMPNGVIAVYTIRYVTDSDGISGNLNVPYNGEEVSVVLLCLNTLCVHYYHRHNLMTSLDYCLINWSQ